MTSLRRVLGLIMHRRCLLAAYPSDHTPVVAATACLVPFLLDPAAALGRPPPWRMKLQCVSLVAAFLLGVSSAVCPRLPPSESMLASLRLPAWSSVHSWILCLQSGYDLAGIAATQQVLESRYLTTVSSLPRQVATPTSGWPTCDGNQVVGWNW